MSALRGVAWRALVVVAATVAVVIEFPPWARAPLSIAAAVITLVFVFRRSHRRRVLDAVLTAVGAAIVALGLLGLLLNVLPSGLSTASWGIGVGLVELVALAVATRWPRQTPERWRQPRRLPVAGLVWSVLIASVLAGALVWSVTSFASTHAAPLALAAVPSKSSVVVTVSAGRSSGPYELDRVTSSGRTVLADGVTVGPGDSSSITLPMPVNARETIELVQNGSTLRQLILDTRSTTAKAAG